MSTMLENNIQALSKKLGRKLEVLHTGVTGGHWPSYVQAVAARKERSNCAMAIRKLGEFADDPLGGFFYIEGAYVVTDGLRKAKRVRYAIVR